MKTYKTVIIPEHSRKSIDKMICDLCGVSSSYNDWSTDSCDVEETCIEMVSGVSFPDYTNTTTTEFHICPDCFTNKLIPWFKDQGATPTVSEYDK